MVKHFMKNWMRKILMISLLVVIFSSTINLAWAQDDEEEEDYSDVDAYVNGNLSVGRCLVKGDIDFGVFLDSIIWSDGLIEGVFEPWVDVISRNQCHIIDISNLVKQRDKIRKYIRDAFLTCNNQKLAGYKDAFNKLNAELYYVRHVVDPTVVVGLPFGGNTQLLFDEGSLYYPEEKLKADMYERYVEGRGAVFSETEFNVFFNLLSLKYIDRKESYVRCESGSWEEVAEKWEEFIDTAGGLSPAWDNMEKGIGGRAEKIVEAATEGGWENYLSNIVQLRINKLDPIEGISEIGEALADSLPEGFNPTHEAMFKEIENTKEDYNRKLMLNDIAANFEVLYKDTNDETIGLFIEELENLDRAINNSFDPLNAILQCSKTMNLRQCNSSR
ncbi:hypothetical protein ACFL21_00010 [Patescibacteria group bacterium]